MLSVIARDADLARLGPLPWLTLKIVLRYQGVSSWQFTMDAAHPKAALVFASGGVIVEDDETGVVLSGPTRVIGRKSDDGQPTTTMTVTGVDDTFLLATRLCYPDPAHAATNQSAALYDVRAGVAETVMKAFVNVNLGPGALTARRAPAFTIATDLTRGPSGSSSVRFDNLIDVLTSIGKTATLGYRIVQVGSGLIFDVYEPQDLSGTARWSRALGNLRGFSFEISAPTSTDAIVAGDGIDTARTFIERSDPDAETDWGARIEQFVDGPDDGDATSLAQVGDQALLDNGPGAVLSITPIDTPLMKFGRDYNLGDLVSVDIETDTITDVVLQVRIDADPTGTFVQPSIGTVDSVTPGNPKIFAQLSNLAKRTGLLERRK